LPQQILRDLDGLDNYAVRAHPNSAVSGIAVCAEATAEAANDSIRARANRRIVFPLGYGGIQSGVYGAAETTAGVPRKSSE
jgi:hypothetical protein